jgi:hypothetical protein
MDCPQEDRRMRSLIVWSVVVSVGSIALPSRAQEQPPAAAEAALRTAIDGLRVPDVAWRKIAWKTCLLDGLAEAQRTKRPIMLWCQIDRPIDDTRC